MPEQNKQSASFDFPPMAPPPAAELEAAHNYKGPNFLKKIGKKLGAAALAIAILAPGIAKVDSIAKALRYPADSIEIIQAAGADKLPKGGTEWLVFGGYGQKYSVNAAQELSNALDGNEVVASIRYPNQEFTIEELADVVNGYIQERDMSKLNIVGISMGMPVALLVLNEVKNSAETPFIQYQNVVYQKNIDSDFEQPPEIGYSVAYSSPADINDTYQGGAGETIVNFANVFDYRPGILAKAILASFDGEGDAYRSLNILDSDQWVRQVVDNIKQTVNDTPPEMVWSQIKIIVDFKEVVEWQTFQNLFSENSHFVYIEPSGDADPTVNTLSAYQKFKVMLQHLDVPSTLIRTNEPGHANTVASASALSAVINLADEGPNREPFVSCTMVVVLCKGW